jgi:hypothetical protein
MVDTVQATTNRSGLADIPKTGNATTASITLTKGATSTVMSLQGLFVAKDTTEVEEALATEVVIRACAEEAVAICRCADADVATSSSVEDSEEEAVTAISMEVMESSVDVALSVDAAMANTVDEVTASSVDEVTANSVEEVTANSADVAMANSADVAMASIAECEVGSVAAITMTRTRTTITSMVLAG